MNNDTPAAADSEHLTDKQAYTIRHTAILAYKHGDITKLELEALLDRMSAARDRRLELEARDKQLQGQLHEVSMALAVYENNPADIHNYLLGRKQLVWDGLAEHQRKTAALGSTDKRKGADGHE